MIDFKDMDPRFVKKIAGRFRFDLTKQEDREMCKEVYDRADLKNLTYHPK